MCIHVHIPPSTEGSLRLQVISSETEQEDDPFPTAMTLLNCLIARRVNIRECLRHICVAILLTTKARGLKALVDCPLKKGTFFEASLSDFHVIENRPIQFVLENILRRDGMFSRTN